MTKTTTTTPTMTMNKRDTQRSKRLSWLLRHGAPEAGLAMDPAGWVAIDEVLAHLQIDRGTLARLVASNTKQRLQVDGPRIRCCQGHSADSGVVAAALEASWEPVLGDAWVWHGTTAAAIPSIARDGVLPQRRTHVHLAPGLGSVVGKRAQVAVMLAVDPPRLRAAGENLWRAPNGVILARWVPPAAIVDLQALTRRAQAEEPALRAALFGGRAQP